MPDLEGVLFTPEQLCSIKEAFARSRALLLQSGSDLEEGVVNDLATVLLKLSLDGLSGEELVETAVRTALTNERWSMAVRPTGRGDA